jgi:hypothetical protein
MSPWKKTIGNFFGVEPPGSSQQTGEVEIVGDIYDIN